MKLIVVVIYCYFNLIIKIKIIGFEYIEYWRFEDNCYEIILFRKLVIVYDFYCVFVSVKF